MDRRVVRTKTSIREAYYELLIDKNTRKITVKDVAEKANIDRKTFYLHYETLEDVLQEFCQDKLRDVLLLLERNDFFENPSDISAVVRSLQSVVEEDMQFFTLMAENRNYDFFWEQVHEILAQTIREVYGSRESVDGERIDSRKLDIYADFFVSGILTIMQKWIRSKHKMPLQELQEILSDVIEKGAGAISL